MMFSETKNPIEQRRIIGYTMGPNAVVYHHHCVMRITGPLYLGMSLRNGKAVHSLFLFFDDKSAGLKLGPISLEDDIDEYMKTHITGRYDTPENLIATLRKDIAAHKPIDNTMLAFARQFAPDAVARMTRAYSGESQPVKESGEGQSGGSQPVIDIKRTNDDSSSYGSRCYSVELQDYSMPAISEGTTLYYGTQEDILALLACSKRQPKLLEAAQDYFSGKGDGTAKILYEPIQFLHPVNYFGMRVIDFPQGQPFQHTHMNVWDCPYKMQAEKIEVTVHYLQNNKGAYLRCAKVRFLHLQYKGLLGKIKDIHTDRSWGYPGMIVNEEGGWITNRLLYAERQFVSKEAMEKDMENPDQQVELTGFFNEIFGDG